MDPPFRRILGFLDLSRYFFFQVVLKKKLVAPKIELGTSGSLARNSDR
jgi:hypothetical protein